MPATEPQFPTTDSGQWVNAVNVYADQGINAYCEVTVNGTAGRQVHAFGGFGLAALIPAGVNIDSVTMICQVFDEVSDGSAIDFDAQPRVSGVAKGTRLFVGAFNDTDNNESPQAPITSTPTAFQHDSVAVWTVADFSSFDVQVRGWTNNATEYVSLGYITINVTYSEASVPEEVNLVSATMSFSASPLAPTSQPVNVDLIAAQVSFEPQSLTISGGTGSMTVVAVLTNDQGTNQTWIGVGVDHPGKRIIVGIGERSGAAGATCSLGSATLTLVDSLTVPNGASDRRSLYLFEGVVPGDTNSPVLVSATDVAAAHARVAFIVDDDLTYSLVGTSGGAHSGAVEVISQVTGSTPPAGADLFLVALETTRGAPTSIGWAGPTTHTPPNPAGGNWDLQVTQGGTAANARHAGMGYASLIGQAAQAWSDTVTYGTARMASALIAVWSTGSAAPSVDLVPAALSFIPQALTPASQPVNVDLVAASMTFAPQVLTPVPIAPISNVDLVPVELTLTAVALDPQPSAVSVAVEPASLSFGAQALEPSPGLVSVELVPATLTFTAQELFPVAAGGATVVPASLTFTPEPLEPQAGLVDVDLSAASMTFAPQELMPAASGEASLASATLIFEPQALNPTATPEVDLVAASMTFTAMPIGPIASAEVELSPATLTFFPQPLMEGGIGAPDGPYTLTGIDPEHTLSAIDRGHTLIAYGSASSGG